MSLSSPKEIKNLNEIINNYDLFFVDLWGVIHNGVNLFDNAIDVLKKLQELKKKVVLLSNAPRTNKTVSIFLENLGFNLELVNKIITSGDVTKKYLQKNNHKKFFHLGPDKDKDLFEESIKIEDKIENCEEIICTGLVKNLGLSIEDYDTFFQECIKKKIRLVCANPDEVVVRGNIIEYCAGGLANFYKKKGGEVIFFGKPYDEIYHFAHQEISFSINGIISKDRILAIGDNLKTDIFGAQTYNIDSLLILNGIYKDFFRDKNLNFEKLIKSTGIENLLIKKFQKELIW